MPVRAAVALGVGVAGGLLSAAIVTFCGMGEVAAPKVFGYCVGMREMGLCQGVDVALYVVPGAVFGVLFIAWEAWRRRIDPGRVIGFAVTSGIANAIAVFLCVWLTDRLPEVMHIDSIVLPMALAGAISGAAGGALLSGMANALSLGFNLRRSIVAAAVLGLLVPLAVVWDVVGAFLFFAVWQGGYATALTTGLSSEV